MNYRILLTCLVSLSISLHADWETDLRTHIAYWQKNGAVDAQGRRYDGNWNRGQWLLEGLRKEKPAIAAQLQPQMLPGSECFELAKHNDYWRKHGLRKDGNYYDGDWNRGKDLLKKCSAQSPAMAITLESEMLEPSALQDWKEHVDYWDQRGVDLDPLRGKILYDLAKSIDPVKADEIAARAPQNLFKHTEQFIADITQGKMPEAFKLKGKLSDKIKPIPEQLDKAQAEIAKIPDGFVMMYTELCSKKLMINTAIKDIESGQKPLAEASQKVESNILVPVKLKKDLLEGLDTAQKTLPEIERILKTFYKQLDQMLPGVTLQAGDTEEQFTQKVKDRAQEYVAQDVGVFVDAVIESLSREYKGVTLSQSLAEWANALSNANL